MVTAVVFAPAESVTAVVTTVGETGVPPSLATTPRSVVPTPKMTTAALISILWARRPNTAAKAIRPPIVVFGSRVSVFMALLFCNYPDVHLFGGAVCIVG